MESGHHFHFHWNIGLSKTEVMCDIGWSSSHYRRACAIPDPDTDTVVVTGGRWTRTTSSVYGKEGWLYDLSSELRTGRLHHGCTSYKKYSERVMLFFVLDSILLFNLIRCCWSLGVGVILGLFPRLRCIAIASLKVESGLRSLPYPGLWRACVW